MKSRLSATHLLRHLLLFVFIGVFLLTMIRAAYVLWQFPLAMSSRSIIDIFAMGVRYDLALLCIFALPVLVLGGVFGLLSATKGFAKVLVVFLLMFGMVFLVVSELITPYFLVEQGVRPDLAVFGTISDPVSVLASLWSTHMIPALIGVVLAVLVIIAYWARLEISHMFRLPLSALSTIPLLIIGVVLCAIGIYSHYDPSQPPLSPTTGLISTETVLNEITLNTGYKMLYSMLSPFLPSS